MLLHPNGNLSAARSRLAGPRGSRHARLKMTSLTSARRKASARFARSAAAPTTGICTARPCPPGPGRPCSSPARRRRPAAGGKRLRFEGCGAKPAARNRRGDAAADRADGARDAELDLRGRAGDGAARGTAVSGAAATTSERGRTRIQASEDALALRNSRRSMSSLPTSDAASPGVPLKSSTPTASLPLESLKTYLAWSATAAVGEGGVLLRTERRDAGPRTPRLVVAGDGVGEHVAPAVGRLEDEARLALPRQPIELLQGDLPEDELARPAEE